MSEVTLKNVRDPFSLRRTEGMQADIVATDLTLEYVSMMTDVELPSVEEPQVFEPENVPRAIDPVPEKSKKYDVVVAWWELWHNETVINNAVEKGWITQEEAQEIMNE